MPILNVQLIAGRPPELRQQLIAELTRTTVDVLDVPAASVRVILTEVPAEHWGVGGISRGAQQNPDQT